MIKLVNLLIVISSMLLVCGCTSSNDELKSKLKEAVMNKSKEALKENKRYSLLRLSSLTNFGWDKFYIFDEYVTNKDINEITGIKWNGNDVPGGEKRILFINAGTIVQYVDFDPGTFPVFFYPCGESKQFEFSKRDDLFCVFKECDKNGCNYAMVPERCIKNYFLNKD